MKKFLLHSNLQVKSEYGSELYWAMGLCTATETEIQAMAGSTVLLLYHKAQEKGNMALEIKSQWSFVRNLKNFQTV